MTGICEVLDSGDVSRPYSAALAVQAAKLADVRLALVAGPAADRAH